MRRRRSPVAGLAVVVTVLSLSACGSESEPDTGTAPTAEGSSAAGAFPATVETKFGAVSVAEQPARVVALGWGDAETALALGVQPVGASDWLGFGGEGVGPWADGMYDAAPQIIETLEPSYEAIAALEPDLILDTKSSGDQERYERLASIAPTVGVPEGGDSYLTTTEQQTTMIATALGKEDDGARLLADIDTAFEEARAAHPDWDGRTVTAATKTSEGWGAYIEGGERVQFMESLGFVQNPAIAALEPNASGFSVSISAEQLDLLDADLIVSFPIFIPTTDITDDPLFQQVPAVADGRSVVIDGDLSAAYSLGTTLAQAWAIDNILPLIEDATA